MYLVNIGFNTCSFLRGQLKFYKNYIKTMKNIFGLRNFTLYIGYVRFRYIKVPKLQLSSPPVFVWALLLNIKVALSAKIVMFLLPIKTIRYD